MSANSIREVNALLEGVISKLAGKVLPEQYIGIKIEEKAKEIEKVCEKTLRDAEYAISSAVAGLFVDAERMMTELRDRLESDFGRKLTDKETTQLQEEFSFIFTDFIEKNSRDQKKYCFYERYKEEWKKEGK